MASLPADSVPGDRAVVPITVSNTGKGTAAGRMDITLYATTTGQLDGSEIELAHLVNQPVNIRVGASRAYRAAVTLPAMPKGAYRLVAVVDASDAFGELDETNNVAVSDDAAGFEWRFGNVGARRNVRLTVPDGQGRPVALSLTGPGTGTVVSTEGSLGVGTVDTTPASVLSITPLERGASTTLTAMLLEGSFRMINAPAVDLAGSAYVLGSVGTLRMHDLADGALLLGRSYEGGPSLDGIVAAPQTPCTIVLNELDGATVESALQPVKSITAARWIDGDGDWDLMAPRVDRLTIRGDFGADLLLTGADVSARQRTLGAATITGDLLEGSRWDVQAGQTGLVNVGGTVRQSVLRFADNVGSIIVGATDGSDFGAGVALGVLTADRHALVDAPQAIIGSFTVKGLPVPKGQAVGRFFADSFISAGIGTLNLLNWDGQGGLYGPADGIGRVVHRDTADRSNTWIWPAPPKQVSADPDDFVHLL
ncbi:MAG: hypothetical protein GX591_08700 [Planctomycetes bacterium]|nr:hypothetical protein [Planctomycetota bacterium]